VRKEEWGRNFWIYLFGKRAWGDNTYTTYDNARDILHSKHYLTKKSELYGGLKDVKQCNITKT